jgi:hypothetical protein
MYLPRQQLQNLPTPGVVSVGDKAAAENVLVVALEQYLLLVPCKFFAEKFPDL